MFPAVEWGTGQVLWSLLWFFLIFVWFWLVLMIFADLARSAELPGWGKALWVLAVVLLPVVGILAYLVVRGGEMSARSAARARRDETALEDYLRETVGSPSRADQLATLAELHDSGKLTDDEYASAKAAVLT